LFTIHDSIGQVERKQSNEGDTSKMKKSRFESIGRRFVIKFDDYVKIDSVVDFFREF
jgi:hypothetical protein